MLFTPDQIVHLAQEHYHLQANISALPGEIDLNFLVTAPAGKKYVLKIANPEESRENLDFQQAMIQRLAEANLGLELPLLQKSISGQYILDIEAPDGSRRMMRLLSWVDGRCIADVNPHSSELLERVGEMLGKMNLALQGFDHPAAHRNIKWDPQQAAWTKAHLSAIKDSAKQQLAAHFLDLFEQQAQPLFPELRQSVIYGDANDYNILVSHNLENPTVPGVIDFGDSVYSHTVNDLAIAAAYLAMDKPDPLAAIADVVKGFHCIFPLKSQELAALFPLIGARLLISVTCSAMNLAENEDNNYLQISDKPAWALMAQLAAIPPALALATFRHACAWEPCPQRGAFDQWLLAHHQSIKPVVTADLNQAKWLDLSVSSPDLGNYADIEDAAKLDRCILDAMDGKVGIGRYDEARPFYTTDAYEVWGNNGPVWRSIHIGLDIFMAAGTAVFAPLDGIIHSFQDNAQERDYGPAIILEHQVSESLTFYTLYGHLSRTSLDGLEIGQKIKAGQEFCQFGPMPENGNWSPHLHFQVILDMLGKQGDFPGVAFPEKRAIWTSLCPDPWLLLTGQPSPAAPQIADAEIMAYRKEHLGKNLSVSYKKPLTMHRGWGAYLFDATGRRYLDTVNNVAHVGHEHPRVVRAGQRQMAVLNTNTRYLHPNINLFTEALLATFPAGLDVAFLVNSGSEANELAMRLAKIYTGQQDMIVLEHGYHGNTQGCVDISSYKFDGPGGAGPSAFVQVLPMPDVYRGIYRANTPETCQKYASYMETAIASIQSERRGPAAFIGEAIISCGGQVPLPEGYLQAVVKTIRGAGGLYIADEVQTGCGRHGQHFWAYEAHGVLPDIVTVGKPIGNGHPLAAVVTTRAIADAFANGMEYFNTFGGNPVSCAIGLEVLQVIKSEGLQQKALETGNYLMAGLQTLAEKYTIIGDVRGSGLFLGFELVQNPETREPAAAQASYLANRMRELGVLMSIDGPAHNVLKIKPPMSFGKKQADVLLEMLARVFGEDFMNVTMAK